jgi:hypothetical protein
LEGFRGSFGDSKAYSAVFWKKGRINGGRPRFAIPKNQQSNPVNPGAGDRGLKG